jgi:hypothetical protein
MSFTLHDLDERTRELMGTEVDRDVTSNAIYRSERLTADGNAEWENLLRAAIAEGDVDSFASGLGNPGGKHLNAREPKPNAPGDSKAVPHNAGQTMAEGEYNRVYIRALCVRATKEGRTLVVYRARPSQNPDPESEAKIGTTVDPQQLLDDLRSSQGVATALGLPPHPNSGLSVRLD